MGTGVQQEPPRWQRRSRCCGCTFCAMLSIVGALAVIIAVRRHTRGQELEALMQLITNADLCMDEERKVCELDLSEATAAGFDLHERDSPLLGFLFGQVLRGAPDKMRSVLSGAHVQLRDPDGFIYDFLRGLPRSYKRISSHRSSRAQYGVPEGKILSALLVGTLDNSTWLQLEGSAWDPLHQPWASMGHILDYIEYKILRKNIGPLGISGNTDWQPLFIKSVAHAAETCPQECKPRLALIQLEQQLRGSRRPPSYESPSIAGAGIRMGSHSSRTLATE
mmetsp:Transcript_52550/g.122243  ORF Transcript_52550/g.122243 Transcript_52550/m.122243 type:complete len:279 (-) Transcript_52550:154-990(-)